MSGSSVVKYRKVLNKGQLAVLGLLYKYRFSSVELLRTSLGLNIGSGMYQKLAILVEQGYVGKRYDKDYRLRGRAAAYFLLPKGFKTLQRLPDYADMDEKFIKYSYKDKTARESFIDHCQAIQEIGLELQRLYPKLKFFTKRELAHLTYMPEQLPDAFISLRHKEDDKPTRFFLEYLPHTMLRYVREKKISDYVEFFEDGTWEATGEPLPNVLLLCETKAQEKIISKQVKRVLYKLDAEDEPMYLISNLEYLKEATPRSQEIWADVNDRDDVYSLIRNSG